MPAKEAQLSGDGKAANSVGRYASYVRTAARKLAFGVALTSGSMIAASVITFAPLFILPPGFETDFVNGRWVLPMGLSVVAAVFSYHFAPLNQKAEYVSRAYAMRFFRVAVTSMPLAFWPLVALAGLNSYAVKRGRYHDMAVLSIESAHVSGAVSTLNTSGCRTWKRGGRPTFR